MAFKEITSLDADKTISIGGFNKKLREDNPTSVEGYYLGSRKVESKKAKNGFCYIHFLKTPKGNLGVWGKTDLDRKLTQITPGTMVRVTFDKTVPTPNGEMYKFRVEQDETNAIAVTVSADVNASSNDEDDVESDENDEVDDNDVEEAPRQPALSATERKSKVEALLKRKSN